MQFANLKWSGHQPFSLDFNDIYYASDHGQQETEYVFITQNNLIQRFSNLKNAKFTILETGFGTGLNFFCTVNHWLAYAPQTSTLQFISVERYPLTHSDFAKANQAMPQFSEALAALMADYAKLKAGINHISLFENKVVIELWIGEANELLPQILTPADALFLDGFAPAKNADMWSENIFRQISRLSHPNTTFSTFTSAGNVRRSLEAAGFKVQKITGYGKKREMLCGTFSADACGIHDR